MVKALDFEIAESPVYIGFVEKKAFDFDLICEIRLPVGRQVVIHVVGFSAVYVEKDLYYSSEVQINTLFTRTPVSSSFRSISNLVLFLSSIKSTKIIRLISFSPRLLPYLAA